MSSSTDSGASSSGTKKILLRTSDGVSVKVGEAVILMSGIIRTNIESGGNYKPISVPNVDSKTLAIVIQYCKHYTDAQTAMDKADQSLHLDEDEMKILNDFDEFEKKFEQDLKNDDEMLREVATAAHYLDIQELLHFSYNILSDNMKGKEVLK